MTLQELIGRIVMSQPSDWHVMAGHPTYRDELMDNEDGDGNHWISIDSHHSTAAFIPDVSITLAWGLTVNEDFREPWANKFPDTHAASAYADVFYNGALVYRALYVLVDGARCLLPLPDQRLEPGGVAEAYAQFVNLLDRLTGHGEFAGYFERAGLARMPGRRWPEFPS
jgi:hypothetical protein